MSWKRWVSFLDKVLFIGSGLALAGCEKEFDNNPPLLQFPTKFLLRKDSINKNSISQSLLL